MCVSCGCDAEEAIRLDGSPLKPHPHHGHTHPAPRTVSLERALLARNDELAATNRAWLDAAGAFAINLIGSPGSGKTSLLEATVRRLAPIPTLVLEGDQETELDAERLKATGCRALQINTGPGCHLDAQMVHEGLHHLEPERRSLIAIENVGNLVCPALFALGEHAKVVVLSVTEGEEKPLKYPHVFREAQVLVLTKIDLLPHLRFDLDRCLGNARRIHPGIRVFPLSTATGEGLDPWCEWLHAGVAAAAEAASTKEARA